jgi:hypothetical protein
MATNEDTPPDDRRPGTDRRWLARKVALGGAAAWVAPTLLSAPASAGPGSGIPGCTQQPFNWITRVGVNNAASGPYTYGTTTLTVTNSTTAVPAASVYQNRISPTTPITGPGSPQGNQNSYYTLGIGSAGGGPYVQYPVGTTAQSTFTFGRVVSGVAFTILDIDSSGPTGAGYRDIVQVNWSPGSVTASLVPVSGTPTFTGTNPYTASGNATATQTTGNLQVTFNGPISSFQIVYTAGTPPGNGTFTTQIIGVSNLTACV